MCLDLNGELHGTTGKELDSCRNFDITICLVIIGNYAVIFRGTAQPCKPLKFGFKYREKV